MTQKSDIVGAAGLAHGMDGSLVEPDWPPLKAGEVRTILRDFDGCNGTTKIISVSPRPFSAASLVEVCGRQVFVKRHHRSIRDREGLREEHCFLAYLRANDAPVPQVLATHHGETAIETTQWTYEVHATPDGIDLYEEAISWAPFRSTDHARSAGQMLARLHQAAEGFEAPERKIRPLVSSFSIFASTNPAAALQTYICARPALADHTSTCRDCAEALQLLTPFHVELSQHLCALKPLWTHNDFHASNLFWSEASDQANAVAAIDFGLADRTNAVHDLAIAIERNIVEWLMLVKDPEHPNDVVIHFDHLSALLGGYEQVRPLSDDEAAALAPMTAVCHAEFALTEADYFLGVLRSPDKARVATRDYLVGHAHWFHSAAGRELLDSLRRWATDRKAGAHQAARR